MRISCQETLLDLNDTHIMNPLRRDKKDDKFNVLGIICR